MDGIIRVTSRVTHRVHRYRSQNRESTSREHAASVVSVLETMLNCIIACPVDSDFLRDVKVEESSHMFYIYIYIICVNHIYIYICVIYTLISASPFLAYYYSLTPFARKYL